jgi:serpin B
MPYAGEKLAMDLFLPEKADGLEGLERQFVAGNLGKWLSALDKVPGQEVVVLLPRFRITVAFELNGALKSLGMADAFDLSLADLSGMDGRKPPDPAALFIAAALHKAFVDVNEEGTEAAAATAIEVEGGNGHQPPVFNADHPFIFLIRDRESGSILFLGRVANPKQP